MNVKRHQRVLRQIDARLQTRAFLQNRKFKLECTWPPAKLAKTKSFLNATSKALITKDSEIHDSSLASVRELAVGTGADRLDAVLPTG